MHSLSSITEPTGIVTGLEYLFAHGASNKTNSLPIKVTMLGDPVTSIAWPCRETVGIFFNGLEPLTVIESLLEKEGFRCAEELKREIEIPRSAMTCRNVTRSVGDYCLGDIGGLVHVEIDDPKTVLRHALILGLCGPTFYDPHKAVIWTNNRLSKELELFEPERWYADN